jgi:hypothetical protein
MRLSVACVVLFGAALPAAAPALAAGVPPAFAKSASGVIAIGARQNARQRDCVPYNGPFGFYGNIWCQPNEASYMRNLGASWPQKTPAALKKVKPSSNYEW